jgi:hypothetical protein
MHNQDRRYLELLSIFYYVLGGIHLFFLIVSLPLLFQLFGLMSLSESSTTRGSTPPEVGSIFSIYRSMLFVYVFIGLLIGLSYAIATIVSGRCLARRKWYGFSFTVAYIQCIYIPFGTILGIVTLNVLLRDSVRTLYGLDRW